MTPLPSLAIARRAATESGVTRFADVTGLDRIGIPVWQAVRPWSKSITVHQGKGLTSESALIGACLEAVEFHHAEGWVGEVRLSDFDMLPAPERLPAADDCSRVRGATDIHAVEWSPVERMGSSGVLWVPKAAISLNTCVPRPPWVLCSSGGQGAGFDFDFATCKALFELLERDAFAVWLSKSFVDRAKDGIAIHSVASEWFQQICRRLTELNMRLRVFAPRAVVDIPVIVAEIVDPGPESRVKPYSHGICAHADAETALKGAIVEAAQCRLTEISGARDDMNLERLEISYRSIGLALPMPSTTALHDFGKRFPPHLPAKPAEMVSSVIAALSDAGYPVIGRVRLSPANAEVTTVKTFVPGLAAGDRARRVPL